MTSADTSDRSLRDIYLHTIDDIVRQILTGERVISKEYIYQTLVERIELGTSELFEGCLSETVGAIDREIASQADEVKRSKLQHKLNALGWIQTALARVQDDRQAVAIVQSTIDRIVTATPDERLTILLQALDPNQERKLERAQIQLLIKQLPAIATSSLQPADFEQLRQLAHGLDRGLKVLPLLEPYLVSWIYEGGQQIGFGGVSSNSPWELWARQLVDKATPVENDRHVTGFNFVANQGEASIVEDRSLLQSLFMTIDSAEPTLRERQQSIAEVISAQATGDEGEWTELAIVLQSIQTALVTWFDGQMYDRNWGVRMAFSTQITFAVIWCEIANGVATATGIASSHRDAIARACFQVALQVLRTAAQRPNFPLYGGIFAAFTGETLRDTLSYFDRPLKQIAGTQEKGRILTILGYSQRALGQIDRAIALHQEALEIATSAGDRACEIANLNHLARISIAQKDYQQAISWSQRALISARQTGDRLGEANALINTGYAEVLAAHAIDSMDEDLYERQIEYLDRGLKLATTLEDSQSMALGYHSLGLAYLTLNRHDKAIESLQQGTKTAQAVGDLYLQGLNLIYLGEAHYAIEKYKTAIFYSCLSMYQLHQIGAKEWRQAASLATVLQGKLGADEFNAVLTQYRSNLIPAIGVDGFDYLPQLMVSYLEERS